MTEEQMKKLLNVLSGSRDNVKGEQLDKMVESALNEKQKKRLAEVLENRELAEKLLESDEAKKLMKKFAKWEDS